MGAHQYWYLIEREENNAEWDIFYEYKLQLLQIDHKKNAPSNNDGYVQLFNLKYIICVCVCVLCRLVYTRQQRAIV